MVADRAGVVADLYAAEVRLNTAKRDLLETYLEIHEHTADPVERGDLAQRMGDVMATRPLLDMEGPYFVDAYAASIALLDQRAALLRRLADHQVGSERATA